MARESLRLVTATACVLTTLAAAGTASATWVPSRGDGYLQLGFSRKAATTSWDAFGDTRHHTSGHDFRYTYLYGVVGLSERFAGTFLVTHLDGREGPSGDMERNVGLSDAWLGVRYAASRGPTPVTVALTLRTAALYDIDGPYSRYLYDSEGEIVGLSPEWRGLLREDLTLSVATQRSLPGRITGWWGAETGYTRRVGAPADELPLRVEVGTRLPWRHLMVKATSDWVWSLGNDSPRGPQDRFSGRPDFNFNDASMGRVGLSLGIPLDSNRRYVLQTGYNVWIWGRSARKYDEPFLGLGYRF